MEFEDAKQSLVDMGIRHTLEQCSSSNAIKIQGGKSYFFPNGDGVEMKWLKFISDTKKEVIENAEKMNLKEVIPRFIRFSPYFPEKIKAGYMDYIEIDIQSAYWYTAHDFGLISKSTFEAGKSVPKKVRLMALGAAASAKDIIDFDGAEYHYRELQFNDSGRKAFFNIAKRVDTVMGFALDNMPGMAFFYWVDALFVKTEFWKQAVSIIQGFGYETKATPLLWLTCCPHEKTVEAQKIIGEKNGLFCLEHKIYFKPRKNQIKKPTKNAAKN